LGISAQVFEDYKSKYLDLYDKVRTDTQLEKVSILQDVDFEIELLHRDEVNVAYIISLLAKLHTSEKQGEDSEKIGQKEAILQTI
jgi:type I restriction enzyme R subunit